MPENQSPDGVTRCFLVAVAVLGFLYVGLDLTPSSYSRILELLKVSDRNPVAGSWRDVRTDEYEVSTPYFQAAVRNGFQRINQTSFYREDMRNYYALPLADWSLAFKPQLWAFFIMPPDC